ncbi:kinase-like protein [Marasmius fiardii PR-910]|nr:kinase-like protein [Marasmius fiardii PR-910]
MLAPLKPTSSVEFEHVLWQIQGIIYSEQQRKELLRTKGDTAQQWLDLFQLLAEYPNVSTTLRPSIFKLMIRLSRKSGLHPQCLTIRGVEKLGDYPVGGGAFGDVWQGRVGQQLVCLKVIRVFNQSDVQQILKDYMQEGIVWRQLNHPNVLPFMGIYYLDSKQRQLCLVSPWMERGNLVEFLKNSDNSVDRMLLAYDVACGLAHLHAKNIVHGDLKGVNILVTPDLRACITDFGLSRVSATQPLLTETSRARGTTRWLSPELLTPDQSIFPTRQSDVYAYACVCYEIFTGRFPFYELAEAMIVIAVYLNKRRPSRPEECPQLRDAMWYLMGECWNETPSLRPTMADVLVHIEEMNVDRRLEPASNWNNPVFTQLWSDVDHPSVIHTGESNPLPSASLDPHPPFTSGNFFLTDPTLPSEEDLHLPSLYANVRSNSVNDTDLPPILAYNGSSSSFPRRDRSELAWTPPMAHSSLSLVRSSSSDERASYPSVYPRPLRLKSFALPHEDDWFPDGRGGRWFSEAPSPSPLRQEQNLRAEEGPWFREQEQNSSFEERRRSQYPYPVLGYRDLLKRNFEMESQEHRDRDSIVLRRPNSPPKFRKPIPPPVEELVGRKAQFPTHAQPHPSSQLSSERGGSGSNSWSGAKSNPTFPPSPGLTDAEYGRNMLIEIGFGEDADALGTVGMSGETHDPRGPRSTPGLHHHHHQRPLTTSSKRPLSPGPSGVGTSSSTLEPERKRSRKTSASDRLRHSRFAESLAAIFS